MAATILQTVGDDDDRLHVVAPCDMQAGYTFLAQTDAGDRVPVTVPLGGVAQGQVFFALNRASSPSSIITATSWASNLAAASEWTPLTNGGHHQAAHSSSSHQRNGGQWKQGLLDCCANGPFDVSLWQAMLCPQILAAQVWTRLHGTSKLTAVSIGATALFWSVTLVAPLSPDPATGVVLGGAASDALRRLHYWVTWAFFLYTLILLTRMRTALRHQHGILASQVGGVACTTCCFCGREEEEENHLDLVIDACVSLFCTCCSVAQAARQTNHGQAAAACWCTATGRAPQDVEPHPPHASFHQHHSKHSTFNTSMVV